MPELPEVETVARRLARHAAGRVIESVWLSRTDIVHGVPMEINTVLPGRRIVTVERRGKQVHIQLADQLAMVVHLGMTGRLLALARTADVEKHTHLRMPLAGTKLEVRFIDPRRFGGIWLVNGEPDAEAWRGRRLPPVAEDPLRLSLAKFRKLICRKRQIKPLLLDQEPVSGVGNIYCDEALHIAGIHPLTRACDIDDERIKRLWQALRRVMNAAIRAGGSSISNYRNADNQTGLFQVKHRVYGREGQRCRGCGGTIEKFFLGGRGTHICPRCQPR